MPCPECAAPLADLAACQLRFHELNNAHRSTLLVDAYSSQHAAYIQSAKSWAAHLVGLCLGLEHGLQGPQASRSISAWLDRRGASLQKPVEIIPRARLTIVDAGRGRDALHEYAESCWDAWHTQHGLIRGWADETVRSLRHS
jgi:hypothetical protein